MPERLRLTVLASCAPVASPCLPGLNTRSIIFKAAPFAVSRCRVTLGKLGPRRLPAFPRTRRPGSLKITLPCVTSGGCTVTVIAAGEKDPAPAAPALVASNHRASLTASRMPTPSLRLECDWAGSMQSVCFATLPR